MKAQGKKMLISLSVSADDGQCVCGHVVSVGSDCAGEAVCGSVNPVVTAV